MQAYERAVHLNPANAQLVAECGRAHHAVGDLKAAEASYRASLAIDPGYTPALLLLGDVLVAREDWPEALEAYSQAVALDDSLTGAWRGVGYARSRLQDWERAAEAYLEVLQREPDDYNALWTLALLNGEMNRFDVALGYACLLYTSCVVTLYGALRRRAPRNAAGAISGGDLLLVAGLLAGIVAHLIEIHYGTAVAATRAHFWLYACLLYTSRCV